MTIATIPLASAIDLPHALRRAQEAIHFPEVQEMLRRLSEFKLGIFMPHMHDEKKGEFKVLPDEIMQVESGLEVTFKQAEEIANHPDRFLPVGWVWRAGAASPASACEMVWDDEQGAAKREVKHKMPPPK
jgi:hypothetical protein